MKKIAILLSSVAMLSASAPIASSGKQFSPYAGIQIGAAYMGSKMTSGTGTVNIPLLTTGGKTSDKGSMWGAHLGFDYFFVPAFAAGLDLGFNFVNSLKATYQAGFRDGGGIENSNANVMSLRQRNRSDIAARFKFALGDRAAPYIKLGYSFAKFKAQSQLNSPTEIPNAAHRLVNKTKRLGGMLLGLGVDLKIVEHLRAGIDYTYVSYGKLNINHSYRTAGAVNESISRSYKPQVSAIQLRFSYVM